VIHRATLLAYFSLIAAATAIAQYPGGRVPSSMHGGVPTYGTQVYNTQAQQRMQQERQIAAKQYQSAARTTSKPITKPFANVKSDPIYYGMADAYLYYTRERGTVSPYVALGPGVGSNDGMTAYQRWVVPGVQSQARQSPGYQYEKSRQQVQPSGYHNYYYQR